MTQPQPPGEEPPQRGPGRRRSGERRRGTGWFPRGRKQGPFLLPLPDHSETGVLARLSDHELRARGLDPEKARRRRRRLASRTFVAFIVHWRYAVSMMTILAILATLLVGGRVRFRDSWNDSDTLPTMVAPTEEEVTRSIELGKQFLNALYKTLPGEAAVQSEASGAPFRAYFTTSKTWVLLGEEKEACIDGDCRPTTSVNPITTGNNDESLEIAFSSSTAHDALRVLIKINWSYEPDRVQVEVTPRNVAEPVELWLDRLSFGTLSPGQEGKFTDDFPASQQSLLRMLRFTIRHATQEAYLFYNSPDYGNDPKRAAELARFLERNNYTPGLDMRAPLFGQMGGLPDDLPFNDIVYPDCRVIAASSELAYAYKSKICGELLGVASIRGLYVDIGARDPFLQAWQALTTLEKYNDPKRKLPNGGSWMQGKTPEDIARHLQGQWNRTGFGVPKCTPFACPKGEMSGIRTSVFGALQTRLGYRYGNANSKAFADAAARMIITAQIGADGKFRMKNGTYYRPAHAGAYLAAWDTADGRFVEPSTPKLAAGIALFLAGERPIPPEYLGIVPSNSETSLDALGFLYMYRCERYKVCSS